MSAAELITMALHPLLHRFRMVVMQNKLNMAYKEADYFRRQLVNGTAGLQDSHKRIAFLEADLAQLRRRR